MNFTEALIKALEETFTEELVDRLETYIETSESIPANVKTTIEAAMEKLDDYELGCIVATVVHMTHEAAKARGETA